MSYRDAHEKYEYTLSKAMAKVNAIAKTLDTTDILRAQKLRRELFTYVLNNVISNVDMYHKPHIEGLLSVLQGVDKD